MWNSLSILLGWLFELTYSTVTRNIQNINSYPHYHIDTYRHTLRR